MNALSLVATERELWILYYGLQLLNVPLKLLLISAAVLILIKAKLLLAAHVVVKCRWRLRLHSRLDVSVSQVKLGILRHYRIRLLR